MGTTREVKRLKGVAAFLKFIRDNDHHAASWHPQRAAPGERTYFSVRGYLPAQYRKVTAETARGAFEHMSVSKNSRRMWDIKPSGLKLIEEMEDKND